MPYSESSDEPTTIERHGASPGAEGFVYSGLREWLEAVDSLGQLRCVSGAGAEEEIGAATDVLQHTAESPAALFDQVPGYNPGFPCPCQQFRLD